MSRSYTLRMRVQGNYGPDIGFLGARQSFMARLDEVWGHAFLETSSH